MSADSQQIRSDIDQTRAQMGDTVEALGYKADVPTRAKESVQDKVQSVKSKVTGATPDAGQVKGGAKQAASTAQSNPLGLAVGAVAVGFLAGMLIPETQKEHEALGEMSDQVTGQLKDTAQEALDHGKQVAQQTAQAAKETAQQAAQDHGEQLKDSARENAEQTRDQVSS
jgi:gas vesicle protein